MADWLSKALRWLRPKCNPEGSRWPSDFAFPSEATHRFHRRQSSTMKLGITTSTFQKLPFEEALEQIKGYGFDAIELTSLPGIGTEQGHPAIAEDFTDAETDALKTALGNAGLKLSAITTVSFGPLNPPEQLKDVLRVIEVAAAVDGAVVTIHANRGTEKDRTAEELRPEVWSGILANLEKCVAQAEKSGVRLAIETEMGLLLDHPDQALQLIAEIDSPTLGYNFCTAHIVPAISEDDDLSKVVERSEGRIYSTHMADIEGRIHKHLVPGEGDIDFPDMLARLRAAGFDGYLNFDLYPYADRPEYAGEKTAAFMLPLLAGK